MDLESLAGTPVIRGTGMAVEFDCWPQANSRARSLQLSGLAKEDILPCPSYASYLSHVQSISDPRLNAALAQLFWHGTKKVPERRVLFLASLSLEPASGSDLKSGSPIARSAMKQASMCHRPPRIAVRPTVFGDPLPKSRRKVIEAWLRKHGCDGLLRGPHRRGPALHFGESSSRTRRSSTRIAISSPWKASSTAAFQLGT